MSDKENFVHPDAGDQHVREPRRDMQNPPEEKPGKVVPNPGNSIWPGSDNASIVTEWGEAGTSQLAVHSTHDIFYGVDIPSFAAPSLAEGSIGPLGRLLKKMANFPAKGKLVLETGEELPFEGILQYTYGQVVLGSAAVHGTVQLPAELKELLIQRLNDQASRVPKTPPTQTD